MQSLATRQFTIHAAADLGGAAHFRAVEWARHALLLLVGGGGRRGVRRQVDWSGVIATAVIAELRRRGLSREAIRPISQYVCGLGAKRLLRYERDGRLTLLVSAGQQKPRLVDAESVGMAGAGGMVMAVDLRPIVAEIRGRISIDAATVKHTRVPCLVN